MQKIQKIWHNIFIFIYGLILLLFFNNEVFGDHQDIHLLGYPRSGNHWIRLCTQKLIKASSLKSWLNSYDPSQTPPYRETETSFLDFSHLPAKLNLHTVDQSKHYLIVILRNYRECIMRHYKNQYENMPELLRREYAQFSHTFDALGFSKSNYLIDLKCYDQWNPKTRLLIYYEELMQDPEKILKSLMSFLGKDESFVDEFMQNFEELQNESYNKYKNPQSRHFGLDYHTSLMPEETILYCDQFMKEHYPEYWDKYLSRFEWQKD